MQSATPVHGNSETPNDGVPDEMLSPQRVPRPPSSSRPFTAPHPVSLRTSVRSVAMVQRVLSNLSGRDGRDETSLSKFVREGIALQHSILEEIRERAQTIHALRRTQAASSLDWSKRSDDIVDNMAILEGVSKELSKKADAQVAELTERQAAREKELVNVAAKAKRDAQLLMDRTATQLELMRHATQTVVRCFSSHHSNDNLSYSE